MNELERFREVTTFIFDVDGVLTNSQLLVMEDGSLLRQMNVRDGYAIKRAEVDPQRRPRAVLERVVDAADRAAGVVRPQRDDAVERRALGDGGVAGRAGEAAQARRAQRVGRGDPGLAPEAERRVR